MYELLKRNKIETEGRNVVVISRVKKVGVPITLLLRSDRKNGRKTRDATVTMCNKFTPNAELTKFCQMADIIVSAAHIPELIVADMVKPGATIIDAGFSRSENGQVGDVDFENVLKVAGKITPWKGGVGPMIVATLMRNTLIASKKRALAKLSAA